MYIFHVSSLFIMNIDLIVKLYLKQLYHGSVEHC